MATPTKHHQTKIHPETVHVQSMGEGHGPRLPERPPDAPVAAPAASRTYGTCSTHITSLAARGAAPDRPQPCRHVRVSRHGKKRRLQRRRRRHHRLHRRMHRRVELGRSRHRRRGRRLPRREAVAQRVEAGALVALDAQPSTTACSWCAPRPAAPPRPAAADAARSPPHRTR